MAIEFAHCRILNAKDHDVCGYSAYISREKLENDVTGERFDFRSRREDLVDHGVILPNGAPDDFRDPARLWSAATAAEYVTDRKTGERRLSAHGKPQTAYDLKIALPRQLTAEQNRELLHDFLDSQKFDERGAAIQWAIHDDGGANIHAHVLVTTREIGAKGFGGKLRGLMGVDFARDAKKRAFVKDSNPIGRQWGEFQDAWFRARGISMEVDRPAPVPRVTIGNARGVDSQKRTADEMAQKRNRAIWADPETALAHLTSKRAVFTQREIEKGLQKAGFDEIATKGLTAKILRSAVRVADQKGRHFWTSREVQTQERKTRLNALSLKREKSGVTVSDKTREKILSGKPLAGEQRAAFDYATGSERIGAIQGRAGTGKSFTIGAIRDAYETSGSRVIGLAPTNAVAATMRNDGFREGRTVASELKRQENLTRPWDKNTVVVVDEAGMLSTNNLSQLISHAKETGAKILLVGDDRQLASIERGGMFSHIAKAARAVELSDVRRQKAAWMKDASMAASRGDLKSAVAAYGSNDRIMIGDTQEAAIAQLAQDWRREAIWRRSEPFVYASTNKTVNHLNKDIREIRKDLGRLGPEETIFATKKRENEMETTVSAGDRIQFHATVKDREAGLELRNSEFGTVKAIDGTNLTVEIDGGRIVTFDAAKYNEWGLGYVGTIYKGQGKTNDKAFVLHDSNNLWKSNTSYVAMTRHKDDIKIYSSKDLAESTEQLGRLIERDGGQLASLDYKEAPLSRDELKYLISQAKEWDREEGGRKRTDRELGLEPELPELGGRDIGYLGGPAGADGSSVERGGPASGPGGG